MQISFVRFIVLAGALASLSAVSAAPVNLEATNLTHGFFDGASTNKVYLRATTKPKPKAVPAPKAAPKTAAKPAPKAAAKTTSTSKSGTCKSKRTPSGGNDCPFNPAPGVVFKLGTVEGKLGAQIGSTGKATVFDVDTWQGHPHPGMVLKIFKAPLFFKQTEVEALKDVNLLIASGEVGGKHVIAMHKANGESLEAIFASLGHDKTKIETFMKPLRSKIAHEVAQIAKTKGIFQNDLHSGNIFIDKKFGNAVTIIDWGQAVKRGEAGFTDDEKKILAIIEKNTKSSS